MKKSITRRFFLNGVGLVTFFLLFVVLLLYVFTRRFYYQSAEQTLLSYANASADLFHQYMTESGYDVEAGARDFIENFRDKEIVEVQFLDASGNVRLSTSGFLPAETPTEEWSAALQSENRLSVQRINSALGEHIVTVCAPLMQENVPLGGLRYVASLGLIDRQLHLFLLGILLAAMVILFFVILSSTYFIGSIVDPVREIGKTARSIAMGAYETRVEKRYDDEIGDLCDTINYMAGEIGNTERMKNEFISSVSHELRTPLTAIKGWSETLREMGTGDAELTQKGLSVIAGEADRLSGIVEELLDFSRIQSGRFTMKTEKVDLVSELEDVLVLFRERAAREGIRLQYIETESLPAVIGDGARLRQVLINILDNAIKYTEQGGTIRVEAADMGASVQIVVSDSGIGIPAADLPLVKDKFYRVSKHGGIPGSGIGLAIADEIMKQHGGDLTLESTEHVGTSVILTLPTAEEWTKMRGIPGTEPPDAAAPVSWAEKGRTAMEKEREVRRTSIGGQALIEGVMMRGPYKTTMAVRHTSGQIVTESWNNLTTPGKGVRRIPFVRGIFNFIDSMRVGYKALMRSAELSGLEEETESPKSAEPEAAAKAAEEITAEAAAESAAGIPSEAAGTAPEVTERTEPEAAADSGAAAPAAPAKAPKAEPKKAESGALMTVLMTLSAVLGVALAIVLFIWLPSFLYGFLKHTVPAFDNRYLQAVCEGVLRMVIFIGYLCLTSLLKDLHRVYMYHGAEHKTIFCYEHGLPLTVENVQKQSRFHPRCGTSFMVLMLIVGMFISMLIPSSLNSVLRTCVKLLCIPLVVGVGYEAIKLAGRKDNWFTRMISAPGLWVQRITTKEPTPDMIECAIAAFEDVVPENEEEGKW